MTSTEVDYQNISKGIDVSTLLIATFWHSDRRLSIILSLRLLFSDVKMEKCLKDEDSSNITGVLGSLLAYCCHSLPFWQWDVKCLNFQIFEFWNKVCFTIKGGIIAATTLVFVYRSWK